MADYRLYCLDGEGKLGLVDWITAETDEDAIHEARQLRPDAKKCELWLKSRLVAKLNGLGHLERVTG